MARSKFKGAPNALKAIYDVAIPLFAESGFSGVSMRQVAQSVGISIATLYHHFADKQALYLRCIEESFSSKAKLMSENLGSEGSIEEQLSRFVESFTVMMSEDENFRRLLQRELLDADEKRLEILAKEVFQIQFKEVTDLAKRMAPDCDPHMMAISIVGLVLFHLETTPIRAFLPMGRQEHNNPKLVASHVVKLLLNGISKCSTG